MGWAAKSFGNVFSNFSKGGWVQGTKMKMYSMNFMKKNTPASGKKSEAAKRYYQKHKYEINEKLKNKRKNLQIEKIIKHYICHDENNRTRNTSRLRKLLSLTIPERFNLCHT